MKKAYFNWSSGKDSALALHKALEAETYDIQTLFTIVKKKDSKIAMHEIGTDLLRRQAESVGIPLTLMELDLTAPPDEYKRSIEKHMKEFKERQINFALFGDLYLQDLRNKRIENCKRQNIQAEFPLWNNKPSELLREFIALGFKSIVTCVDSSVLDESFLGRVIDESFLRDLPNGIDICGENGEYHSFAFDGPVFSHPVKFEIIRQYRTDHTNETDKQLSRYCYLELK